MQPIGRAFADRLVASGEFTEDEVNVIKEEYNDKLNAAFEIAKKEDKPNGNLLSESTSRKQPPYSFESAGTGVEKERSCNCGCLGYSRAVVEEREGRTMRKRTSRKSSIVCENVWHSAFACGYFLSPLPLFTA